MLALLGELGFRNEQAAQCNPTWHYLTRTDLPHPWADTTWQHMFSAENDHAFISTMGFDVATFNYILTAFQVEWDFPSLITAMLTAFQAEWNSTPIERSDVNVHGYPRLGARSLDAAGGLALVLHYIHSCMTD